MADDIVKVHGLKELNNALRKLPPAIAKRELQKALRPGATLIKNAAKMNAPRGEEAFFRSLRGKPWVHYIGSLQNAIAVRAEKKKFLKNTAKLRIGVLSDRSDPSIGAWYWRFVEFGTSKQPAKPFLTTAFEQMKYAADAAIRNRLLKGVEIQAKRVRK